MRVLVYRWLSCSLMKGERWLNSSLLLLIKLGALASNLHKGVTRACEALVSDSVMMVLDFAHFVSDGETDK